MQLDDALLQPDDKGRVYLLTHNSSSTPQKLKSNMLLGYFDKYASEQQPEEEFLHVGIAAGSPEGNCPAMATGPGCQYSCQVLKAGPEDAVDYRKLARLESQLRICEEGHAKQEFASLKECIFQAVDVFATTKVEQGKVDMVEHRIETGDHPPIKQPSRRIPFAVEKLPKW